VELLREASGRAHEQANRRLGQRGEKSMQAAILAAGGEELDEPVAWWMHGVRLWLGTLLLVPLGVTAWTFLSVLTEATLRQQFWTAAAFWYFATGVLLMAGWFVTGLLRPGFLYLYVLGHELTHIVFIKLSGGRVSSWGVTTVGGYVTTNKTNIVIALAPYFVPFWSVLAMVVYGAFELVLPMPRYAGKILYFFTGWTWAFHFLWTAWMIPRDQPDLREHGTFLSLMIILLANVVLLAALLCVASDGVSFREFGKVWLEHAGEWLRWLARWARAAQAGGTPA
jgi:hypothetical protein